MATLAESFLADLEDLSDVEDEEPQQGGPAGEGEDEEVGMGDVLVGQEAGVRAKTMQARQC